MKVHVVQMRRRGIKCRDKEMREAEPTVGELLIDVRRGRRGQVIFAQLVGADMELAIPMLDDARITLLRGANFVLQGMEQVQENPKLLRKYVQSWWCRLPLTVASERVAFEACPADLEPE